MSNNIISNKYKAGVTLFPVLPVNKQNIIRLTSALSTHLLFFNFLLFSDHSFRFPAWPAFRGHASLVCAVDAHAGDGGCFAEGDVSLWAVDHSEPLDFGLVIIHLIILIGIAAEATLVLRPVAQFRVSVFMPAEQGGLIEYTFGRVH